MWIAIVSYFYKVLAREITDVVTSLAKGGLQVSMGLPCPAGLTTLISATIGHESVVLQAPVDQTGSVWAEWVRLVHLQRLLRQWRGAEQIQVQCVKASRCLYPTPAQFLHTGHLLPTALPWHNINVRGCPWWWHTTKLFIYQYESESGFG